MTTTDVHEACSFNLSLLIWASTFQTCGIHRGFFPIIISQRWKRTTLLSSKSYSVSKSSHKVSCLSSHSLRTVFEILVRLHFEKRKKVWYGSHGHLVQVITSILIYLSCKSVFFFRTCCAWFIMLCLTTTQVHV